MEIIYIRINATTLNEFLKLEFDLAYKMIPDLHLMSNINKQRIKKIQLIKIKYNCDVKNVELQQYTYQIDIF